ncbi:MAG: cytochrome c maturation protein CcmE [Mailhella sp.]|nr:cytochrome c maturation protein CcmE [Mailhella sp.]
MKTKKNAAIYLIAFLLFAGGVSFLAWTAFFENSVYHLNVSEALALPAQQLKSARLFGVAGNDIVKPENGLGAKFTLHDLDHPDQAIIVDYHGALPDTFEHGAEVIVEGSMGQKVFQAKVLMTKCPSKYEKSNREQNGRKA